MFICCLGPKQIRLSCANNPCYKDVQCYDDPIRGFRCGPCSAGFTGNGTHCEDINECDHHSPCDPRSSCMNAVPGFYCLECPKGFQGSLIRGIGLEQAQTMKQVKLLLPVHDFLRFYF